MLGFQKKDYLLVLVLVITTLIVFGNSFGGKFLWDNRFEITENAYIKDFRVSKIFSESTTAGANREGNFYRPLVSLLFAIDYKLWGQNSAGFHFTNLVLHIISGFVVFYILLLLNQSRLIAFLTSLLFLIHPLQVESVTYIAGRSDGLFGLLSLLSIALFIKYRPDKPRGYLYYLMSILALALAILSKEIAVITPFLILLVYLSFKRSADISRITSISKKLIPFFLLSGIYFILRLTWLEFGQGFSTFTNMGLANRLLVFINSIQEYFKIIILPLDLRFRLDTAVIPGLFTIMFSLAIIMLIVCGSLRSFKKNRLLFYGFGWFFIGLAPVSNILLPVNYVLGERWLRLPSIGFFFLMAVGIIKLSDKWQNNKVAKYTIWLIVVGYLMFLGLTTIRMNRVWDNEVAFYSHQIKYYPNDLDNRFNLAIAYKEAGLSKEAHREYRILIEKFEKYLLDNNIKKSDKELIKAYKTLSSLYFELGEHNKAIAWLEKFKNSFPNLSQPYALLGEIYFYRKNYGESARFFEIALSLDPQNTQLQKNLGVVRGLLGR